LRVERYVLGGATQWTQLPPLVQLMQNPIKRKTIG
jgi:hypothetical protein